MITTLTIGKGVVCENVPAPLLKKVKKDLTFENPDYKNAMKYGQFISADMPQFLYLMEIEGDNCWIPRGYIYYFLKWLNTYKKKFKIRDKTLLLPPLDLKFLGKLRPYQSKAMPDMLGYPCGVLEAATGSGKTVMAIYLIVKRGQPTLIIVHSKELLYQWQKAIKKFTGEDCGLIGDQKEIIKPITVGIINSVRTRVEKLNSYFGHIIVDECHRISSESWADTVQGFNARYYLGLTATPFRADGLGDAIFACIGPKRHKVNKKELQVKGAVLKPSIKRISSNFSYLFTNDYSTMISELTKNEQRNSLIVREIHSDLKKHNENILIVSDRQKHLKIMQEMLYNKYKINGHVLTGSVKSTKVRKKMLDDIRTGRRKTLFATTSLIGEGFDAPELVSLFLTTPIKFSGRLIQACGRVLRPKKGKFPRIYDIRDNNINVLKYSGYNRDRIYKKEGWY